MGLCALHEDKFVLIDIQILELSSLTSYYKLYMFLGLLLNEKIHMQTDSRTVKIKGLFGIEFSK